MNLDYAIEKYESELAYCEMNPSTNVKHSAEIRQLIEWLKDYKRLLEAEKNWRKSLEDEIANKDEKIRSLKAELDKPITFAALARQICLGSESEE